MKKLTLVISGILAISAYFVATQPITPRLALVSSVSVLFFAIPSYFAILKLLGWRRGFVLLTIIGLFALFIESLAIKTGFPYGEFVYKDVLGNKIFGLTPWTVAFAYPPIVLLAYWYGRRRAKSVRNILVIATFTAVSIDLVLDPAAVKLGFWYWPGGGIFYSVPLINFLGWILTSYIAVSLIHAFLQKIPTSKLQSIAYSGLATVWFWTCVNVWLGHIWPSFVGLLVTGIFIRNIRGRKGIL